MPEEIKTKYSRIIKGFPHSQYFVINDITDLEKKTIDMFVDAIKGKKTDHLHNLEFLEDIVSQVSTQEVTNTFLNKIKYFELEEKIKDALKKLGINDTERVTGIIMDKTFGFGKIGPLLRDNALEEIMINRENQPVFVYHREIGMCKTNIVYEREELQKLLNKIAKTVGKEFNDNYPVLDARLIDGSRANATYDSVTPFGYSLTIRKFSQEPLSIIKLIENETISDDAAAFLWLCIDGLELDPQNILIIGGAGSGKTTLLMALTSFIRYSDRVITIEDTPELNLTDRENYVSMEARIKTVNAPEINMDDLLKNALRMRPDRIIVGEVRGSEAQTLFTAMDTGHNGILGTLHANNSKETILRLKNKPMEVPENSISLLNLIINIKKQNNNEGKVMRKVIEVTEVEKMDNTILLSNIYERQTIDADLHKTNVPARTIESLAKAIGVNKTDVTNEIQLRKNILKNMLDKNIFDYEQVTKTIQKYYEDPDAVIKEIYKK